MESIKFNGTIVLDMETDEDQDSTIAVLRKLIGDGYSVDVHPYMDEEGLPMFVKVDIYDEDNDAEEFEEDYHAAAFVDDEEEDEKGDPLLDF